MTDYQCLCAEGTPERCPCNAGTRLCVCGHGVGFHSADRPCPCGCPKYTPEAAVLCNCWYRPDGSRIGYTIAAGCQAHPNDQVTDEDVWKP